MKIRTQGNTIRFRLNKEEVSGFAKNGELKDEISFGASSLTYQLISYVDDKISVSFVRGVISVNLPKKRVIKWADTEQVGLNEEVIYPNGQKLSVLIEKDFQCLVPRKEDESGLFANPLKNSDTGI
jgi:hypothetical protein